MNNITVLLVDDEEFNYDMLSLSLGNRFDICFANTGQKALAKTIESCPDILLLDVCMPGLDGYDTCRLLKNTPETANIPIILLSGLENEIDKKEGFNAGCDDYVTKPFEMTELIEKIELQIAKRKMK